MANRDGPGSYVKEACSGCLQAITDSRYICCNTCWKHYDLICANVPEHNFTKELRDTWKCVMCVSSQPKTDNTNTPVRAADGVTVRRGAQGLQTNQVDVSFDTQSFYLDKMNDTAHNETPETSPTKALIVEMRLFREELMLTRTSIQSLNGTIARLTERMDAADKRADRLEERIAALERASDSRNESGSTSSNSIMAAVEQLKAHMNEKEQEALLNEVEISCVAEEKGESLPHIVMTLASKVGVQLAEQEIVSAVRVGRGPESAEAAEGGTGVARPRIIVVRLARRALRDSLLAGARVRRGATTEGTRLPGAPRRFYINERLTRTNRQIFRQAREAAGRLNWRFVWTRNGYVFARHHQGVDAPRYRLSTEADLARVFGRDFVGSA